MSLHSTMSLLLHVGYNIVTGIWNFTFHYVSITTPSILCKLFRPSSFTFHYVSITTKMPEIYSQGKNLLYIPLCLYYYRSRRLRIRLKNPSLHSTMSLLLRKCQR